MDEPQYPWGNRRSGLREWLFGPRKPKPTPPICADTGAPKWPGNCWNVRCQLGKTCCRASGVIGTPAAEYLAKVEADPQRAAALQRARERAAGVAPCDLPVKWTGADGATHEISLDYAARIAKWMFDTHGDVPQVDAVIAGVGGTDGR